MLKKIGKITQRNITANKILKEKYKKKGINYCELNFYGCMRVWGLGFAHLHKRIWYYKCPELLSDFKQTILACTHCHQIIENNKKLTDEMFARLRP